MKKNNAFPQLYPETDTTTDVELGTVLLKKKNLDEGIDFNDPNMDEFFQRLAQNPSKISNEAIPIISKFIKHSKLMEKVEAEYSNDKKQSLSVICNLCAGLLQFKELKKGEILFRIDDIGDKFFFVINGKLSLLKPKDITKVKMTIDHYLRYLLYLKKKDELYVLQEIIKKNYHQLPIENLSDLNLLYRIVFIMTVQSSMNQKGNGIGDLEFLFKLFDYSFQDFKINEEMIKRLWYNKSQRFLNANTEWEKFLSKKFKITTSENVFFERYQKIILENDSKEWTCSQFEILVYFTNGAFFGDSALDSVEKRRFGSVRAEKDSVIAYMKEADYLALIAPNRKKQKAKEISFLNDNFFLRNISAYLFEKNYYHHFTIHNYLKNHVLFQSGSHPKELIFLQEGKVEIKLRCSLVDLHNMIKYLIDEITKLPYFVQGSIRYPPIISKSKIAELKEYLRDSVLTRMKSRAEDFIHEMNRIRSFQLFILAPNEVIGIEEMILKIPYLANAKVMTVNATFFKLEEEKLNKIIGEEKSIFYSYSKLSAIKLVSLIERIYHLKTTSVELALFKAKQNEDFLFNSVQLTNISPHKYSLTTALEYVSLGCVNSKEEKERMSLEVTKEEGKEKQKAKLSLLRFKKDCTKDKHQMNKILFSNPKIAIESNHNNLNIDVSSQYTNFDDKIVNLQEKKNKDNTAFIDFKNKYISLSQIQQEIDEFSSVDESQNVIQVVALKGNYEMQNDPSKYNYSKFPRKDTDNKFKTMEIAELVNSTFHMSYVPLLNKKCNITPYNSPKHLLTPIKYDEMTERNQFKQLSLIDADKIPFIANFKKHALCYKNLPSCQYSILKSMSNQATTKNIILEKINRDYLPEQESTIIPNIVRNYYQGIKNLGYSILANTPHNTFIKKKIKLIKSNNNYDNTRTKRLRVSKSCNEMLKEL